MVLVVQKYKKLFIKLKIIYQIQSLIRYKQVKIIYICSN